MLPPSFLAIITLFFILPFALCAEDYYKLLGLDKSASERDIKRAYRTLSKKYHPDKNPGDEDAHKKFVDVAEAYDTLSTASTRKIYDQYGHEGIERNKQGGGGGHDPMDLFSRFFGGGGGGGGGGFGQRSGPDMELRLELPLRDFYTGRDAEFGIEKQLVCDTCDGSGSADGKVHTCGKCKGQGMVIQKHMLAPGMFQQVQMPCDKCSGKGKTIRHPCKTCHGQRVVQKRVTMTADIEPGMGKGTKLVFENEADENPDYIAGDLIVHLAEEEPALGTDDATRTDGTFFRRKGKDLFWKEVLGLREAWMGNWSRNITHLDGHVIQIGRGRGEVVQPLSVETIKGEGMPIYREGHMHDHSHGDDEEFGSLYIEYAVVLPDQMESGMEKDFFALWEKWRKSTGVDLGVDSGRPIPPNPTEEKDEL